MPRVVNVPGVGAVNFPDDATNAAVQNAPSFPLNTIVPAATDATPLMDFGPAAVAAARARLGNVPKSAGQVESEIAAAQTVSPIPKEVLPPYWYGKALEAAFPESPTAQTVGGGLEQIAEVGAGLGTPGTVSTALGLAPLAGSKLAQLGVAG